MDHVLVESPVRENSETQLPVRAGILAGIAGSLSIVVVITGILILNGEDLFAAARMIASVVYGAEATGAFPIVLGTMIHLATGAVLGAIFARLMPRMYRNLWIVAGLMYGVLAWIVSTFLILPILAPTMISGMTNVYVLLLAHVIYGMMLGIAGGSYGLWWRLPMAQAKVKPE